MIKQRKKGSGGKREGSGRPSLYGEKVTNKTISCPESKWPELLILIRAFKKNCKIKNHEKLNPKERT